jgi:hypothetical protein
MRRKLALPMLILCSIPSLVFGAEFPYGTFEGIGFLVEQGDLKMTHKDLYKYKSSIKIEKGQKDEVVCTISATLQKSPNTPMKNDSRKDTFLVQWTSQHGGNLINRDNSYKKDRSTFSIENGKLIMKSWIDRNQLWETHAYLIPKRQAPD